MSISFLLGAGASVDAGLPTAVGLTERLIGESALHTDDQHDRLVHETLCHVYDIIRSGSDHKVDAEEIMTALLLLAERQRSRIEMFVKQWDDWRPTIPVSCDISSIEEVFALTYRRCLEYLVNLTKSHGSTEYLRPIVEVASATDDPLVVATLNYDLTFEDAARRANVELDRGLLKYSEGHEYEWKATADIRLLKLHGSIDWSQNYGHEGILTSQTVINNVDSASPQANLPQHPAVIFGGENKLRPDGEYLRLFSRWVADISSVDDLIVVGYSMRDVHVNEVIRRWLFVSEQRRIVVIDPGWSIAPPSLASDLRDYLLRPDTFTKPRPQRLLVLKENAEVGLPKAIASLAPTSKEIWQPISPSELVGSNAEEILKARAEKVLDVDLSQDDPYGQD